MNRVTVVHDVMVGMRDGVRLATDIYHPWAEPSPVAGPVLLRRTPYGKSEPADGSGWARRFAEHGFVTVVQDCRGCFRSEGDLDFLMAEAADGQDTVTWLRDQPWCDGRVGTWGGSWSGWVQTAMAAAGTAGLAAMVPVTSGSDALTSSVRHGGAMELRWIAWAFAQLARRGGASSPPFGQWLRRWPIAPGETQLADSPALERWVFQLLRGAPDDPVWSHPSLAPTRHLETYTDAPTLLIGGWYDSYARGTLELYERLAATRRGSVRAIVGPWAHNGVAEAYAGDVWFGEEAVLDLAAMHLRWFDRWLRGRDGRDGDDPAVRIFVMGGGSGRRRGDGRLDHGGRWRVESGWPPATAVATDLYLHSGGRLAPQRPAAGTAATTYRFDPADPVPTIGGNVSALSEPGGRELAPGGGYDQRTGPQVFGAIAPYGPLSERPDVVVFETEALREPVEVTGTILVRLWVSTTAAGTDVTAKLIDVYPPSPDRPGGYALNLTDSIVRVGAADLANAPAEVEVVLYPTANLFAAGHRIRLDISSSNFPRFDVNPNTGAPAWLPGRTVVADTTVHHDAAHPSRVVLPVVPA
ncbi:CocE/NonD family hydrolase [Jiangella endophytica]|uniref:CocE/NonD family hydrolase n=1 Tax=Jiangella endophytica TaxID=1623398 RepID=UPI000E3443B0|nr:CocE/NonD family hydrolase [Jiangella endophytica]